MRSRQEMKTLAKQAFRSCYWPCVLVMLLYSAISSSSSFTGVILIVLLGPLTAGVNAFCLQLQQGNKVSVGTMFTEGFANNFGRKVGAIWWQMLFVWLWSLLLVVPGIVKAYSYSMQYYILADCPNVTAKDSLKLSMRMMNGHKAKLFVLHLSFIGWALLSVLTCGLLAIFYVNPYIQQTIAQFYLDVKAEALENGTIAYEELYPAA